MHAKSAQLQCKIPYHTPMMEREKQKRQRYDLMLNVGQKKVVD